MSNPFETDWSNVDLDSESHLSLIEGLSFDTLLLEINCNIQIQEINAKTVTEQFELDLQSRIDEAREIFRANLKNIVKKAKKKQRTA
jgi:hypothetical protein